MFAGLSLSAFAKDWKTVRIASEGAFPPLNLVDKNGKLTGFEIELFAEICKQAKVTCEFQAQNWDGLIPGLLAKKFDMIVASMSITDERLKTIQFSKPYFRDGNKFIAKQGTFAKVDPASLKGKKIGVQGGTISEDFIKAEYKGSDIKSYAKVDDAFLDLIAGRVDLVFNDVVSTTSFLKSKDGANFGFTGPLHTEQKYFGVGIGAGIRKEDTDLKKIFDAQIDKVIKSPFYKELEKKYLPANR